MLGASDAADINGEGNRFTPAEKATVDAHQKTMTTDELLEQMSTLLFYGGEWHARARNSNRFATGATAVEAMFNALFDL